jgi:hypothetical protein
MLIFLLCATLAFFTGSNVVSFVPISQIQIQWPITANDTENNSTIQSGALAR